MATTMTRWGRATSEEAGLYYERRGEIPAAFAARLREVLDRLRA